MPNNWTPEQRARYYENDRIKRAAKATAAGRVPGKKGQPKKLRSVEETREMRRLKGQKYRAANLEKERAYHREYERERAAKRAVAEGRTPGRSGPKQKHATNEEYLAARAITRKRYYQEHRVELSAKAAQRARDKRAAIKAGIYKFSTNRGSSLADKRALVNASANKRRALKASVGGSYTLKDLRVLRWRQNGLCPCCNRQLGEHNIHVDHWVPLYRGGSNKIENIRLLHGSCNLKKGTKHPDELRHSCEQLAA